ncbi:hypothetical protein LCGC14_1935730 [marine sediment metagenome]|uniref:Uncharacterized protein n=1 Tax=marine sediment metagenome TaxID=412755 RepID=A0A0F9GA66_9ZZZZ
MNSAVCANSLVATRLLRTPSGVSIVRHLARQFIRCLGAVSRYEWRFVPKGSVLVEREDGTQLLADRDYVSIFALREESPNG